VARAINLFVVGKKDLQEQKPESMDTTIGQSTGRCNWCNFPGHFERECHIKAKGLPKKDYTQGGQRKQPFNGKCNSCGKIDHMAHNCKVKDVREGEIENKDVDNYLLSKRKEEQRKGEKGVITGETSERSLNRHLPVAFNRLLNPLT
jgi:hypothetical protein